MAAKRSATKSRRPSRAEATEGGSPTATGGAGNGASLEEVYREAVPVARKVLRGRSRAWVADLLRYVEKGPDVSNPGLESVRYSAAEISAAQIIHGAIIYARKAALERKLEDLVEAVSRALVVLRTLASDAKAKRADSERRRAGGRRAQELLAERNREHKLALVVEVTKILDKHHEQSVLGTARERITEKFISTRLAGNKNLKRSPSPDQVSRLLTEYRKNRGDKKFAEAREWLNYQAHSKRRSSS